MVATRAASRTPASSGAPAAPTRAASPPPPPLSSRRGTGPPAPAAPRADAAPPAAPHAVAPPHSVAPSPHAHAFEFGGPVGAAVLTLALPLVPFFLLRACSATGCVRLPGLDPLPPAASAPLASASGVAAFTSWVVACCVLHMLLPGKRVQGTLLPDGTRLTYKLNGACCVFSKPRSLPSSLSHRTRSPALRVALVLAAAAVALTYARLFDPVWVVDHYAELLSGSVLFSACLSVYLFASSFGQSKLLAASPPSAPWIYSFFVGRELNPRLGALDLKQFCELTPGLILWLALDCCFAYAQFARTGSVDRGMWLVLAFHAHYVLDALACEPAILTTMDITTDGFGFMLSFGDLTWVPFTYSLQARFLLDRPVPMSAPAVCAILAVQAVGYTIFRGANSQKDAFRTDPKGKTVAHLRSLPTKRGTRLLVSGWWGAARHINYLGDWVMAWAWCLPCGFSSVVPYFYVVYFGALLVHRERRDDAHCRAKYGEEDWEAYCVQVPWRIVPYVY